MSGLPNFSQTHIFWNFDHISRTSNQINYRNIWFAKVMLILIMTAQVLFFDVFFKKDPYFNAVQQLIVTFVSRKHTFTPTIPDLKLIRICFKTSSNNIYWFPTVYTRLWKRNNDRFQFSRLHLPMITTGARWSMVCSKCCRDVLNL